VSGQGVEHDSGKWDHPVARLGLWCSEYRTRPRQEHELTVDCEQSAQEVHPIQCQPEALALAKSCAGCKDDERPITVGDRLDDRVDDFGLQRLDPSRFSLRQPGPNSAALRDDPVSDRGPEDGDNVPVDELDCSRLEDLREVADPGLDLGRAGGADRSITESRVDVTAQVRL
jgi:hypothetical protein